MTVAARVEGSWADVLGDGRLPRFILICLGVWLHAADSLVTATVMPSVGADLNGYAYFGWATAGYLLGSVMAGASSGFLALRFGLRRATAWSAVLYSLGCVLSAGAPDMATFLAGRLLQGIGGGWIAGFCAVAIGLMFPDRLLPKVYASITSVWGIATLVGPLLGGVFADAGAWRWIFWLFAAQGAGVGVACLLMLPPHVHGNGRVVVTPPELLDGEEKGIRARENGRVMMASLAFARIRLCQLFGCAAVLADTPDAAAMDGGVDDEPAIAPRCAVRPAGPVGQLHGRTTIHRSFVHGPAPEEPHPGPVR